MEVTNGVSVKPAVGRTVGVGVKTDVGTDVACVGADSSQDAKNMQPKNRTQSRRPIVLRAKVPPFVMYLRLEVL